MKKIAVVGCKGKMGSLISKELEKDYIICGVTRENCLEDFEDVSLVIDFATHESSLTSAEFCLKKGVPLIIGSTGQTEQENERINEISKQILVIKKANFSRGIEVLKMFIENVSKLKPDRFEIIEKHHKHKKDKPSGTALELEKFIKEKCDCDIKIYSIREGEEMGEHSVVVYIKDEKLVMKHNVYSRETFVRGLVEDVEKVLLQNEKIG